MKGQKRDNFDASKILEAMTSAGLGSGGKGEPLRLLEEACHYIWRLEENLRVLNEAIEDLAVLSRRC